MEPTARRQDGEYGRTKEKERIKTQRRWRKRESTRKAKHEKENWWKALTRERDGDAGGGRLGGARGGPRGGREGGASGEMQGVQEAGHGQQQQEFMLWPCSTLSYRSKGARQSRGKGCRANGD